MTQTNNMQLRQLYENADITYQDIADITGCSWFTVRSWLAKEGSSVYRAMPNPALELIKLKLKG